MGDRWTLLIVRDLLQGVRHFNELERGLPGISRALLSERLRRLQRVGVVEKRAGGSGQKTEYRLTQSGEELQEVVNTLMAWGARWAFDAPQEHELDPVLLLWWMRGRVQFDRLPRERVVVQFDFRGPRKDSYWLVMTGEDASVCVKSPGFDTDVLVRADLASFYQVWLGRMDYADALRDRLVEVDAAPALARGFPHWFALSRAAPTVRAAAPKRIR